MYMDQFNKVKKQLSRDLDRERYIHTLGVAETAQCLAMRYETDLDRAYLAGLLHDCAKCIPAKDRLRLCGRWKRPAAPDSLIDLSQYGQSGLEGGKRQKFAVHNFST